MPSALVSIPAICIYCQYAEGKGADEYGHCHLHNKPITKNDTCGAFDASDAVLTAVLQSLLGLDVTDPSDPIMETSHGQRTH